jgi:hypothetical protein
MQDATKLLEEATRLARVAADKWATVDNRRAQFEAEITSAEADAANTEAEAKRLAGQALQAMGRGSATPARSRTDGGTQTKTRSPGASGTQTRGDAIKDALAVRSPMTPTQIGKEIGRTGSYVSSVLDKLRKRGEVMNGPGGWSLVNGARRVER